MTPFNADDWLNLLSNKHRRRIIQLCAIRPCYPQEIARLLKITPRAVMKHLDELEEKNIVKRKDQQRPEGGRDLKYYFVPFNPKFDFNLSNSDVVDIELEDVSDDQMPTTFTRHKLISRENISEQDISNVKTQLRSIFQTEIEKQDVYTHYKTIDKKQTRQIKQLEKSIGKEKRVLVKIIRFLLQRFGFSDSFTDQDLIEGVGIDQVTAEEIITILSDDLGVIKKAEPTLPSSLGRWKLQEVATKTDMDYM